MSPKAQTIAIAKACGYKAQETGLTHPNSLWTTNRSGRGYYCNAATPDDAIFMNAPNYPGDLNAVYWAEAHCLPLGDEDRNGVGVEMFGETLATVVGADFAKLCWVEDMKMIHATAAQRAEAFLRTFNLWDDTK